MKPRADCMLSRFRLSSDPRPLPDRVVRAQKPADRGGVRAEARRPARGLTGGAGGPQAFYGKVCGGSFAVGAAMEYFMIRTGFYEKVALLEAESRAEAESRQLLFDQRVGRSKPEQG